MNRPTTWQRRLVRTLILFLAVATSAMAALAQGTVNVTVVTEANQPLAQAQIGVVNTNIGGLTGPDGKVTLRGVPTGSQVIRALRVGYGEQKVTVTVTAGGTVSADLKLTSVAISLTPVVTTATGETRRVEIGNATTSIDVSKITESTPITNMNDVLNGHAPGVLVTPSTQTGSGARIRIRGVSSVSLSNDPIYVIDGIRMTGGSTSRLASGDAQASRLGDLDPDDIENIEIVKGPSAATLYGTDAANGVVVITTKKGRAGAAQWTVYGETGQMTDRNPYPLNYTTIGHLPGAIPGSAGYFRHCVNPQISSGACVFDSLDVFSPTHNSYTTPLGNGYRGAIGAGVRGGSDAVRYNVQASRDQETGIFKLPGFELQNIATNNVPLTPWETRPNFQDLTNVRVNLSAAVTPKLDVSLNTGFIARDNRLLQASNATQGLGSQAFGGPGYVLSGTQAQTNTPLWDYRAWTPLYTYQEREEQQVNRFIGSANINWRPTSWLQGRMDIGNDLTDRDEVDLVMNGQGPPITTTYRNGTAQDSRANLRTFTANASFTGTFNPRPWLNSKTTVGAQYIDFRYDYNDATGTNGLPPGASLPQAGAIQLANETITPQRTLGQFAEEVLAFNDRLFVTGAVRSDQNSAFGTNFQNVIYPKASVSWILSDEAWFHAPAMLHLDQLRLRYAYGKSGVQPGPTDALPAFSSSSQNIHLTDTPGLQYTAIGNDSLQPEQATETETGFEARFFHGRATIDVTYYYKVNKNALISALVAPSLGTVSTQRANLGAIRNSGWEFSVSSQIVDKPWLGVDATLNASVNNNLVLSLGGQPPQIGVPQRVQAGYPVNGFWTQRITGWNDKNHDGILTYNGTNAALNEVFVATDTTFRGNPSPTQFAGLTVGVDLFKRKLRLSALADYRGGNVYYNNTERIRCVSRQNCVGLADGPNGDFADQAMTVATLNIPGQTLDGFLQPGAFIKLREVSATYTLPLRLAQTIKARNASIVLSARNVAKWTQYRGVDPENDFTASGVGNTGVQDNPSDFQTFGAPTYFILRLNLGY